MYQWKNNLLLLVLALLPAVLHWLWLRDEAQAYLAGTGSDWFAQLAEWFYPRLVVERQRFAPSFFIQKADQLLVRWALVVGFIGIAQSLLAQPKRQARWAAWWHGEIAGPALDRLRIAFYLATGWFTFPWWAALRAAANYSEFYRPVLLLDWWGWGFPSAWQIDAAFVIYFIGLGLVLVRVWPVTSAALVAFWFFIAQAYSLSFEKVDHGFATWGYAVALFPVLLAVRPAAYPLRLMQLGVAGAYFLAALEKLLLSGGAWASASSFRAQLLLHPTGLGQQVAEQEWLCWMLPAGAWLFQWSFGLVLLFPRWRWWGLSAGVLFHTGTYLLMGVGGYVSPWWVVYLVFLPKISPKG